MADMAVQIDVDEAWLAASVAAGGRLVVFDLEYTAWEGSLERRWGGPGEFREVVQIGAVAVELAPGLPEAAAFEVLTRPEYNPEISAYLTRLTGITNEDLRRDAVSYAEGFASFAAFTGGAALIVSNGTDGALLAENCGWRGVAWPYAAARFGNLRRMIAGRLGVSEQTARSCDLPGLFGLPPPPGAHTGLGDARAIASALRAMLAAQD